MAKVIRIQDYADLDETVVQLRGKREIEVRRPSLRVKDQSAWSALRPGWGNAKAAANEVLARACVGSLDAAEVRALGEPDRRRLMVAVVALVGAKRDWQGLYGTFLSSDERFLAVTIWARQRESHEGLEAIRTRLMAARRNAPAISPKPAHINSLAKQIRAMNSLSRFAASATLAGSLKSLAVGHQIDGMGLAGAMKSTLSVFPSTQIAKFSQAGIAHTGGSLVDPKLTELTKRWASGFAGVQLRTEMPGVKAQIDALSLGKELFGQQFTKSLSAGMPALSMARQLRFGPPSYLSNLTTRNASALLGLDLRAPLTGFDISKFGLGSGFLDQTWKTVESLMAAEIARQWSKDPLWFLIGNLNPRKVPALLKRTRKQVYDAVLDALEATIRNSGLAEELLDACEEIGFLSFEQRAWLKHGLELARDGEWLLALPPLILGFEGAIFNGAVAANAWAVTRGKEPAAERVIKAIDLDDALREFTIRLVFGGRGNAVRHGRPKNDAREQVLLQVVALIGWVDSTIGTEGTARLAHGLEPRLATSLEAGARRELTAA